MKEARLDSSVEVHVGEPFRIGLRAEGTTGRRWDLSAPEAIAALDTVIEPPPLGFGARPMRYHIFECRAPGDYKIALRLHRPWETEGEHHVVRVKCG